MNLIWEEIRQRQEVQNQTTKGGKGKLETRKASGLNVLRDYWDYWAPDEFSLTGFICAKSERGTKQRRERMTLTAHWLKIHQIIRISSTSSAISSCRKLWEELEPAASRTAEGRSYREGDTQT